jgi:hypothetical protein
MVYYIAFSNPDGSKALVEVDESELSPAPGASVKAGLGERIKDAIGSAGTSLREALSNAMQSNAAALYASIQNLPTVPTEAEISFSLKATGEFGNVAVGKLSGDGNYSVRLVWKSKQ